MVAPARMVEEEYETFSEAEASSKQPRLVATMIQGVGRF